MKQPHPLDRYSAIDRAIGKRITKSFNGWLVECERHDEWDETATIENVKAFLDDYADWQEEASL